MAPARAAQRQPNPPFVASLVVAGGVLLGTVACLLNLPGVALVAISILIGSKLHPSPQLTGKPDARTRMPTPASAYEEQLVAAHSRWMAAGRVALVPSRHWLPGKDPYLTWMAAPAMAAAAAMLPSAHFATNLANAVVAFNLTCAVPGALRDVGREGVPMPGSKWSDARGLGVAALLPSAIGGLFAVVAAVGSWLLLSPGRANPADPHAPNQLLAAGYRWLAANIEHLPVWMLPPARAGIPWLQLAGWCLGLAVAGVMLALSRRLKAEVTATWKALVAGRDEWRPRWEQVKVVGQSFPELLERKRVGRAQVDLFSCSAAVQSDAIIRQAGTIAATIGTAGDTMLLPSPSLDSQGEEVPFTRHPTRFRVVFWEEGLPSPTQYAGDEEEMRLILECGMHAASPVVPAPLLQDLVEISAEQPQEEDPADTDHDGKVSLAERWAMLMGRAPEPEPQFRPAAWVTTWVGAGGDALRIQIGPSLAAKLGCQVIGDHRAAGKRGVLYIGDLSGRVQLDASACPFLGGEEQKKVAAAARAKDPAAELHQVMLTVFTQLATEDVWVEAWRASLKMNQNPPTIAHAHSRTLTLPDGTELQVTVFLVRQGQSLAQYATTDIEAKLATALNAKKFVNVAGLMQAPGLGQAADRHPMALRVVTSPKAVPQIARLSVRGADTDAALEVLAGYVNSAFNDAKLARPEVIRVRCLTRQDARGHIWSMQVRLYDGVTLDEVRRKADKLKLSMGCEWLRVTGDKYGCRIVAGADWSRLPAGSLSKPDQVDVVGLDWEQAWIDGNVMSLSGNTPEVVDSNPLPDNPLVQRILLKIPAGLSFTQLKMARSKLETATQNGFIDIRESKEKGAGFAEMLVAKVSPLRFPEPYRFEIAPNPDRVPFATGIEGAPVEMVLKDMAHFMVVGVTGGGKTAAAQALLTGALLSGADCAIVDAQKYAADYAFARDYCNGWATSVLDAAALMEALYAEVKRRAEVNGRYGVGSVLELPEDVRPRQQFVFADEFFGLIAVGDRPSPKPEPDRELEAQRLAEWAEYNARRRIAYLTGRIAAEARSAGFHLVLMTQKLTRDMIPSSLADLKANLNRIGLGKMNSGDKMSAFREPDRLPELGAEIPPGRGIFEPVAGEPRIVQFWYAPQAEMAEHLAEQLEPVEGRVIDLKPFQVDPQAKAAFTVSDDEEPKFSVVDDDDEEPDGPVETVNLGRVRLDLNLELPPAPPADNPEVEQVDPQLLADAAMAEDADDLETYPGSFEDPDDQVEIEEAAVGGDEGDGVADDDEESGMPDALRVPRRAWVSAHTLIDPEPPADPARPAEPEADDDELDDFLPPPPKPSRIREDRSPRGRVVFGGSRARITGF